MIRTRLIAPDKIELQNLNYLRWNGIELETLLTEPQAVDIIVKVDGFSPVISSNTSTTTLNVADNLTATRIWKINTERFYNDNKESIELEKQLNRWLTMPFKFFTIWIEQGNGTYKTDHDTYLGVEIINPPLNPIETPDADIQMNNVLCIPVKVSSFSVNHIYGVGSNRQYTIEMQSIKLFNRSQMYA